MARQPSQLPIGPLLVPAVAEVTDRPGQMMAALAGATLSVGLTQLDPLIKTWPRFRERIETLDYIQTASVPLQGARS